MPAPDAAAAAGRPPLTILDGGTGRELARIGAPFRQPEWSALALMEAPSMVARVHRAYVGAGADVITTNSYALVPFHIGEDRFAAEGQMLAARAGLVAREVADEADHPVLVGGSLPPVGGSYRPDRVDGGRSRLVLPRLIDGLEPAVDHWHAETLSAVAEAEIVAELTASSGKPLWLSFTLLDDGATAEPRLRSGESVGEAARAARDLGGSALLFNCSQPEVMLGAVAVASDVLQGRIPVGVYANAFPPQTADAEANDALHAVRPDLTPQRYCDFAAGWQGAGADIIGGCCGIGPEHIAALASLRSSSD